MERIKRVISTHKVVFIILVVILVISIGFYIYNKSFKSTSALANNKNTDTVITSQIPIDKDFDFLVAGDSRNPINLKYKLVNAEITKQTVVSGQTVNAINGKSFLVIGLKLMNNTKTPITLNSRDYIRLQVAENKTELFAPDFHSDPIEVQPISTKLTRVGFVIDSNQKTFTLKVGEINKDKTDIPLSF